MPAARGAPERERSLAASKAATLARARVVVPCAPRTDGRVYADQYTEPGNHGQQHPEIRLVRFGCPANEQAARPIGNGQYGEHQQ